LAPQPSGGAAIGREQDQTYPGQSVEKFLNGIKDEKVRQDTFTLVDIMKQSTKEGPKMWGSSIVGFGQYHYKYASGRGGPRVRRLTFPQPAPYE